MDNTKKFGFAGLNLELTRRCNLCCPHCSRGDTQNLTIREKIIDTMLSQTLSITDLLITGGEPLLELDKLEYLVNSIDRYDVPIFRIGMKYEKHYSKKFPDSTKEEIYRLSFFKTYNEFVAAMTLDDLMLALFRGAPAKEYFNRIEKYMKDDHMDNDVFNPCALIPDTIDPRADEP